MVLWTKKDPTRQFIECVDVWIDPAAEEALVLDGLVARAVEYTRESGSDRILFPHFDTATGVLYGRLGLLQGPSWKKREYVKGPKDVMDDHRRQLLLRPRAGRLRLRAVS